MPKKTKDKKRDSLQNRRRTVFEVPECPFCKGTALLSYKDSDLRRFLNDRGRISGRSRTGVCAKHQRLLTREIKRARVLALLPFVVSPTE